MSLRVNATRNITVAKELNYKDNSLDPTKVSLQSGNYLRVSALKAVTIEFKEGLHTYTDTDIKNGSKKDTIESVKKWPTVRALRKKGLLIFVTDVDDDEDEDEIVTKKPKTAKPLTFSDGE